MGYFHAEVIPAGPGGAEDWRLLDLNPAFGRIVGLEPRDAVGRTLRTLIPDLEPACLDACRKAAAGQGPCQAEGYRRETGRWFDFHVTSPREGEIAGLWSDLTARKDRGEEALKQRAAQLRTLLDTLPDLVWFKDLEGVYRACNLRFEDLFGAKAKDIVGRTDFDFVEADRAAAFQEHDRLALEAGGPITVEERALYASDGHEGVLEVIKTPVLGREGEVLGVLGIGRDVTERKRFERDLQRSRASLAALLESTSDLIWSVDRTFRLQTFNSGLDEHFRRNYGTRAFLGATPDQLLPPERAVRWGPLYQRALDEGPYRLEHGLPDGRTLELAFHPILDGAEVVGISVFGKDITDRLQSEESLRASERRYRHLVDSAPVGIFRRSLDGDYVFLNRGVWAQFECDGPEAFVREYGALTRRWSRPERNAEFKALLLRDRKVEAFEVPVKLASGKEKLFLLYGFLDETEPQYFDGFSVDVTELKAAELERRTILEQLHHSQKMDAIGQLAGGVAHDFNNMLAGIAGAADLLLSSSATLAPAKREEYLELILDTAHRAADLTGKLLAFARKSPKVAKGVPLATVVTDTVELLRRSLDKRIVISLETEGGVFPVSGDETLLQGVFMNLGINAGHAMPDGGTLVFRLRTVDLDEADLPGSPFDLAPGRFVEAEVQDTGCGMTEAVRQRIFEPFFTTRAPGQGTGLGLAAAYGTLQDHHGAITVRSAPGAGTTFRILLPVSEVPLDPGADDETLVTGSGTILVVDDEAFLRTITEAMLEDLGYTVLSAANGQEAVEVFRARHQELALVILDHLMPVMGGTEAFGLMRACDPRVPVLLTSGFTKGLELNALKQQGLWGFLRKPSRMAELSRVVAEAVRSGPTA